MALNLHGSNVKRESGVEETRFNLGTPISLGAAKERLGERRWDAVKILAFESGNVLIRLDCGEVLRIRVQGDEVRELFRFLGAPGL